MDEHAQHFWKMFTLFLIIMGLVFGSYMFWKNYVGEPEVEENRPILSG
jgi:hypothetical protein